MENGEWRMENGEFFAEAKNSVNKVKRFNIKLKASSKRNLFYSLYILLQQK